jgi:CysZ protein
MLLGAIPALVVGAIYVAALVVFALNLDAIAQWATPFAAGWTEPWRGGARILGGIALVGGVVLVAVFTFAAVTLAVGDPFYERIWRATELSLGAPAPEAGIPWWRSALGALRLVALTALVGILLFAAGFIPLVGQTVVPVLGALTGGWFLAVELTGFAFEARGIGPKERRRMLGANRARSLGFGILTYLLFLVPFAAIVIMPAAVAGATFLAHDVLRTPPPVVD